MEPQRYVGASDNDMSVLWRGGKQMRQPTAYSDCAGNIYCRACVLDWRGPAGFEPADCYEPTDCDACRKAIETVPRREGK